MADFGLSEDIYARNYFRQGEEEKVVKLPVKWMALESLQDGIFSEKTDVVSILARKDEDIKYITELHPNTGQSNSNT